MPLCLNTILEDLKDVQDGIVSCTSFNLLNLVQDGGQGGAVSWSAVSMTLDPLIRFITGSDGDDDARCGVWVSWPKIIVGATETRASRLYNIGC
jgi:hypothetical protein